MRIRVSSYIGMAVTTIYLTACGPKSANDTVSHKVTSPGAIPLQTNTDKQPFHYMTTEVDLVPRAEYEIAARVVSTDRYRVGDLSDVATVDIALAWGPASRKYVQDQLNITQSGRWYYWRTKDSELPLPELVLNTSMANVHMIGSDKQTRSFLESISTGTCVWLKGQLVDISSKNPQLNRETSMTRDDTGSGACEIFHVENAQTIPCD